MADVKEMNEKQVISIETEDIDKIKKFREDYAGVIGKLGEVEVEILNAEMVLEKVNAVKDNLIESFKKLRLEEKNLTDEFQKKYGNGEFDIEEGTFTPIQ